MFRYRRKEITLSTLCLDIMIARPISLNTLCNLILWRDSIFFPLFLEYILAQKQTNVTKPRAPCSGNSLADHPGGVKRDAEGIQALPCGHRKSVKT